MPPKYARIPGINIVSTLLIGITTAWYINTYTTWCKMPAKYARIPGMNLVGTLLRNIPLLLLKRKVGVKATLVTSTVKSAPKVIYSGGPARTMSIKEDSTKVYVLQLKGGFIYVGQSSNIERRIQQHLSGKGAMFTKRHKPTGVVLPRLGKVEGAGDSGERQEVLLQMRKHGMHRVRGWKYCNDKLSKTEVLDINSNWVEMFNLCRKCMKPGHMASFCRAKKC
jgi:hypothetical protein